MFHDFVTYSFFFSFLHPIAFDSFRTETPHGVRKACITPFISFWLAVSFLILVLFAAVVTGSSFGRNTDLREATPRKAQQLMLMIDMYLQHQRLFGFLSNSCQFLADLTLVAAAGAEPAALPVC